ncbi:MAG: hypothetical protein HKUEN02_19030 [Anaerolineaceae bacterium]|nr:MAG: hypothetical protein HKUEN02_19030 [Anaerolineaceae bacterium]
MSQPCGILSQLREALSQFGNNKPVADFYCGNCSEEYEDDEFSLEDVYAFEGQLQAKHSSNNNVRAKIRQQIQSLRDRDVIQFFGERAVSEDELTEGLFGGIFTID